MLFSFPIPYLTEIVYETEIITRNQSSGTLPFPVTKSKMILLEKQKYFAGCYFCSLEKDFFQFIAPLGTRGAVHLTA